MYALSSREKPKELDGGGTGVYCCIPLCKSATYDGEKNKTCIGFFLNSQRILIYTKDGHPSSNIIAEVGVMIVLK